MGKFRHDTSLTLFFVNHNTVNHYRYILCHGIIGIIIIPDTGNVPLIIFFNMQAYLFAFVWLVALWALILLTITKYYRIKPVAAYLQIPYLVWVTFAGYLNLAVYILNR